MYEAIVIINIIIIVAIAFHLGCWYTKARIMKMMISMMTEEELKKVDELANKLKNAPDSDVSQIVNDSLTVSGWKMLKLEIVANQFLLYDFNDNFVCQGTTKEDLAVTFSSLNKSNACVVTETGDKFFIVEGQIQTSVA